jgi:hypothetical protein
MLVLLAQGAQLTLEHAHLGRRSAQRLLALCEHL